MVECRLGNCYAEGGSEHRCEDCQARLASVCASLSPDEFNDLEALARPVNFAARDSLFTQGQEAHHLFNITSGVVRLYKLLPDGRRQILGFGLPGDFLGLSMRDVFGFSADAVGDVKACSFQRGAYIALVESKPHLLRRLHDFATYELTLAQEQMMLLGRRNAEEKIVCFLLSMQQRWARVGKYSVTVELPMSRQDIADFLGLTIETVSRTLTRLAREKTILIVPDGVRLMNADRMAALAGS
ncbi:MAG: nitrogen fixation protein FixK [Chelatococcus sp.]|nr:MAG: nitrogen fixation protein FixK [Chelatococcus sp.]